MQPWATTKLELRFSQNFGAQTVAGLDEVGRGAFAGPIVAACFVWNITTTLPKVRDSKLLSKKQRHDLIDDLLKASDGWSIGIVDADEINKHGITWANREVFLRAIDNLPKKPDVILYDGRNMNLNIKNANNVIDGDATCATIASASIIAKVIRDFLMHGLHYDYPAFGFDRHVGYGTLHHRNAIQKFGKLPKIHRDSFIHG